MQVAVPVALLALYFLHAFIQTFPMTAYGEWLFNIIHMPPATTTIYYSLAFFPWNLKPVYGYISDHFPLGSLHRKPYIILCEFGAATSLFITGTWIHSVTGAFVVKILDAVFESFSQIMLGIFLVDIAAKDSTSKTSASVQSAANATKNIASIAALVLGIPVYADKSIRPQTVIQWTSFLPFIAIVVCVFGLSERTASSSDDYSELSEHLLQDDGMEVNVRNDPTTSFSLANKIRMYCQHVTLKTKRQWKRMQPLIPPLAFFCLCNAIPSDSTIWYQYTFALLRHAPECLQYLSLAGMIGRFTSCLVYAQWFTSFDVRRVFVVSTTVSVLAGLPRLLLAPPLYSPVDTEANLHMTTCQFATGEAFITSFTSEFALLQLLVVATFYCPAQKDTHGLAYALFLSAMDFGGFLSGLFTSLLVSAMGIHIDSHTEQVDWSRLWLLVVTSAVGQLLVLAFLPLLPRKSDGSEINGEESEREVLLPKTASEHVVSSR